MLNFEETVRLLEFLGNVYPNAVSKSDPVAMAKAWAMVLDDVPYTLAEKAAIAHVKASKYFPTVAELRELAGLAARNAGSNDDPPPDDEDDPLHQRVREQTRKLLEAAGGHTGQRPLDPDDII